MARLRRASWGLGLKKKKPVIEEVSLKTVPKAAYIFICPQYVNNGALCTTLSLIGVRFRRED